MRLGVFTLPYLLANYPVEEALEAVFKSGFRLVNYVTLRAGDMRYLNREALKSIAETFKKYELEPCQFIALLAGNPASEDPEKVRRHMELWRRTLRFAVDLGYKNVLTFPGEYECGVSRDMTWRLAVDRLQEKCNEAEPLGVSLSLEMSPRVYQLGNSTQSVGKLIYDAGMPNLTATVDTGHLGVLREAPDEIEYIKDVVVHAHLSDNDGTLDSNDPLGTGVCDIPGYLNMLDRVGMGKNAERWRMPAAACIEIGDYQRYNALSADSLIASARRFISTIAPHLNL